MYWYMRWLDAGHCCLVVNKGCRLLLSTVARALVVGRRRTRRLDHLSLAYIALAVRIHRTHLLLIGYTITITNRGVLIPFNGACLRRGMATNPPQGHGDE